MTSESTHQFLQRTCIIHPSFNQPRTFFKELTIFYTRIKAKMPLNTIPKYPFPLNLAIKTPTPKPELNIIPILPNLYISALPKLDLAIPSHITHVLTMCLQPLSRCIYRHRKYLHLPMKDEDDITPHIPAIIKFISSAICPPNSALDNKKENNVLVHCVSGINRSAAAILTYLLHVRPAYDVVDAFMHLWEKKMDVCPRRGFLEQIEKWFGHRAACKGNAGKGTKGGKGHRNKDVSRECCDRVDELRLKWMREGRFVRGVDWLWMQQGHGFTVEGKGRFWEKGDGC